MYRDLSFWREPCTGSMCWGQLIFHRRCSWDGGGWGQGVKGEAGMMACPWKAVEVSREVAKQPRMRRERKVLGVTQESVMAAAAAAAMPDAARQLVDSVNL